MLKAGVLDAQSRFCQRDEFAVEKRFHRLCTFIDGWTGKNTTGHLEIPVRWFYSLADTALTDAFPVMHLLKRHPLAINAHFDWCLVLTYALPADRLTPLLPPGLSIDKHKDLGFVACAMVQTRGLRPAGLPKLIGRDFFLAGFRIFARFHRSTDGRTLRGLRILRSLTDKPEMVRFGNLLTHYNYVAAQTTVQKTDTRLTIRTSCPNPPIRLDVESDLVSESGLPDGSVFKSMQEARKFQGPMPFTFDYEEQTQSVIVIKGVRKAWEPRSVKVTVHANTFFESIGLDDGSATLSSAFLVEHVDYQWQRGRRYRLSSDQTAPSTAQEQVIDDE